MSPNYDRDPGPIARAAFETALRDAGAAGLDSAALALVHVPGLPRVSMRFRLAVVAQLVSMRRCVVHTVPYTVPGRADLSRPVYRHACHAAGVARTLPAVPAGLPAAAAESRPDVPGISRK